MNDLFGWINMINTGDARRVGQYNKNGVFVDTSKVTDADKPYETGIEHPLFNGGVMIIVEYYDTVEQATEGQEKWVKLLTGVDLPGYGMKELIGKPFAEIYEGKLDDERKIHIFTRRTSQRSLIEIEFVLKVNPSSGLHEIAQNISYQVSTLSLWNVTEEMVLEKDTEKEFLGSLLIARIKKS